MAADDVKLHMGDGPHYGAAGEEEQKPVGFFDCITACLPSRETTLDKLTAVGKALGIKYLDNGALYALAGAATYALMEGGSAFDKLGTTAELFGTDLSKPGAQFAEADPFHAKVDTLYLKVLSSAQATLTKMFDCKKANTATAHLVFQSVYIAAYLARFGYNAYKEGSVKQGLKSIFCDEEGKLSMLKTFNLMLPSVVYAIAATTTKNAKDLPGYLIKEPNLSLDNLTDTCPVEMTPKQKSCLATIIQASITSLESSVLPTLKTIAACVSGVGIAMFVGDFAATLAQAEIKRPPRAAPQAQELAEPIQAPPAAAQADAENENDSSWCCGLRRRR